ncbi:type I polyketide synthase [Almyronema epifaneia]|uniref:Beta-ketoacyl synthase N-terminal-like domain-containing protein n=1 Tax=Almyronema epifaneia S1 TaxID=2991925 RepID=A0ABW6IK51_9CYAN
MKDSTAVNQLNGLEVAIIGMTGRFPGARNLTDFWHNLQQGKESITEFTTAELAAAGIDPTLLNQPNYVKARAILADPDLFDAAFFDFSPKEAAITDPQHRILLEAAWEVLEQAGYDPEQYGGLIGFYAGAGFNSYLLNLVANAAALQSVDRFQLMLGNDKDFVSTRVSYKLNLQGPSYTVQTACSTSLVAVHLACRSLLSGECDLALAGGITVSAQQTIGYLHHEGGIASPDGHCRAFDAAAAGTVSGNGVGLVALKRLEEAIADGDCIHAVIKGSAINNDGGLKVSYTAPRIDSQAAVIRAAQAIAEVEPDSISYIEAHGTGTALGDPIEIAALTQAFSAGGRPGNGFCAIGSVKTNVGHLDTAAGIAGLIKTVLALQHRQIPPSLHFQQPNPHIDFAQSPFYVNATLKDWLTQKQPRRAGVSSFGIGGTNAHVVLEEAPAPAPSMPARPWQLVLLSAKTAAALDQAAANLATHLRQHPQANLADVAYTLQVGRKAFSHRRLVVCRTVDEAIAALTATDSPQKATLASGHREVVFLLPGQGAQYPGMTQDLYRSEAAFRQQIDHCCQLLQPHLDRDLRTLLYPHPAAAQADLLSQTGYAQPAIFVVNYALAKLWQSWGIQPTALIGHSLGELVAACLAGVFCLEDALKLVCQRGQLMQQCPPGAMLSVPLPAADMQPWLSAEVTLAALNAPALTVLSGSTAAIAQVQAQLTAAGIESRQLHTSHGFHSPLMAEAVAPFTAAVAQVALQPPQIPLLSNVTGTWLTAAEATDPAYWGQQLRQPVQFGPAIAQLLQEPSQILLEVGPGRTLTTLAKQQVRTQLCLRTVRHPQEGVSDSEYLLQTLGRLWLAGVAIDWSGVYAHERRQRLPLPTYPFERQRYWIEPQLASPLPPTTAALARQPDMADWFYLPTWKQWPLTAHAGAIAPESTRWLLFVDSGGVGVQLARQLEQSGQRVMTVALGQQFEQRGDRHYCLNPHQLADYQALLQTLQAQRLLPQRIVHCWSLEADTAFETVQAHGFYSLIHLVQALAQLDAEPRHLSVIAQQIYDITGAEPLRAAQATLLGACQVIPQEYPQLTCRLIDIEKLPPPSQRQWLSTALQADLTQATSAAVIAYRNGRRWLQTFEPRPLQSTPEVSRLRRGGVYLIAGDLAAGLGFFLAQALVETWQAKVLLVGTSGLPAREQWQSWLDQQGDEDVITQPRGQWQALENAEAQVCLLETDLSDGSQLQQAIAQAEQQFGALQGVFYNPAIDATQATQAIAELDPTRCAAIFQARQQGLQVLEAALGDRPLDFCLVQSSLACVLGGVGLSAYAASYAYLDAVVSDRNRRGQTPWFSLNRQARQTQTWPTSAQPIEAALALSMTPAEVWAAIERVLTLPSAGQVVVSTGTLSSRLAQAAQPQTVQPSSSPSPVQPSSLAKDYVAPETEIQQAIAAIWQDLLGIEAVSLHDNFFELGGHSLLAIQVVSRLRQQFAVELPLKSILFDAPTVAGLAQVIHQQQSQSDEQAIAALLEEVKTLSPDQVQQYLEESPSGA